MTSRLPPAPRLPRLLGCGVLALLWGVSPGNFCGNAEKMGSLDVSHLGLMTILPP
jgi:hypothetical protein